MTREGFLHQPGGCFPVKLLGFPWFFYFQDTGKNVTFHIGVRKKNIDMPTEDSFTVREDKGGVKINLTAASEGIEGDVLRR